MKQKHIDVDVSLQLYTLYSIAPAPYPTPNCSSTASLHLRDFCSFTYGISMTVARATPLSLTYLPNRSGGVFPVSFDFFSGS